MIEKLYTVEEVAELASVTGRTIRNYLKSGRLVGRKIGGQWRFPETEVQRLLTGVDDDVMEEGTDVETPPVAPATPAWPSSVGSPVLEEPAPAPTYDVVSSEFLAPFPLPTPEPLPAPPASSQYTAAAPVAALAPPPPAAARPAPEPLPEAPVPLRPQPAPAPPPVYQPPMPVATPAPEPPQQSYFSGDLSQEYNPPAPYTADTPAPAPRAYTPPSTTAPVYAAPISPLPEPEPPYQYREPSAAVVPTAQPAPLPQQTQRPAFLAEPQPDAAAPQQLLYAAYAPQQQGGYPPPQNQQNYQNMATSATYPSLYGQNIPIPLYPPMPQNYYSFAAPPPEPATPTRAEAPPPKQEAPSAKEPPVEENDYPPPTKRPSLTEEPTLSDVGKRVSRFVSEVHDCSSGPLACTVIDIYMSLSSAKSTSEQLADMARQESEGGPLCQSFVEYDERYYVARFTLFGSSAFLFRCLQLIG